MQSHFITDSHSGHRIGNNSHKFQIWTFQLYNYTFFDKIVGIIKERFDIIFNDCISIIYLLIIDFLKLKNIKC